MTEVIITFLGSKNTSILYKDVLTKTPDKFAVTNSKFFQVQSMYVSINVSHLKKKKPWPLHKCYRRALLRIA